MWDHLRVRGSRTAHKKPYIKISSGYRPPQRLEIDLTDMIPEPEFELDLTGMEPLKD